MSSCPHCRGTGKCQDDFHSGAGLFSYEDKYGMEHPDILDSIFSSCPSCGDASTDKRPDCPHCDGPTVEQEVGYFFGVRDDSYKRRDYNQPNSHPEPSASTTTSSTISNSTSGASGFGWALLFILLGGAVFIYTSSRQDGTGDTIRHTTQSSSRATTPHQKTTSASVWEPRDDLWESITHKCSFEITCITRSMQGHGASQQAIAFTRNTIAATPSSPVYLKKFWEINPVDLGLTVSPQGNSPRVAHFIIPNSNPPILDPWQYVKNIDITRDPLYRRLIDRFPNLEMATIYGLDSIHTGKSNERRIVLNFLLLDGCRACAPAGIAQFEFVFELEQFVTANFLKLLPWKDSFLDRGFLSEDGSEMDEIPLISYELSPSSFGPITVGQSIESAKQAIGPGLVTPYSAKAHPISCLGYDPIDDLDGISFRFVDGKLSGIVLKSSTYATTKKIHIGHPIPDVIKAHKGVLSKRPSDIPGTKHIFQIIIYKATSETNVLEFFTDNDEVVAIYAGLPRDTESRCSS